MVAPFSPPTPYRLDVRPRDAQVWCPGSTVLPAGGSGGDAPPGRRWAALRVLPHTGWPPLPTLLRAPDLRLGSAPRATGALESGRGKRPGAPSLCSLPRGLPPTGALRCRRPLHPAPVLSSPASLAAPPAVHFPGPGLTAEPLPLGVLRHLHVISLYPVSTFLSSPFTKFSRIAHFGAAVCFLLGLFLISELIKVLSRITSTENSA